MTVRRVYVYKIVVDSGGAPCVEDDMLSLAICKPMIRRTARPGDLIFAFSSNSEPQSNRLVYIAEVTQRIANGEYYTSADFRRRGDCIYHRLADGTFTLRKNARYHNGRGGDERPRDLGTAPEYKNASVLLSSNFRYFGGSGTSDWKAKAPMLTSMVEDLMQGHRVNHAAQIREELLALKQEHWDATNVQVLGVPSHAGQQLTPLQTDDYVQIGRKHSRYVCKPC